MLFALLAAASAFAPQTGPIALARVFRVGDRRAYAVRSTLNAERRGGELETWMPSDLELRYGFTTLVTALKADGIAVVRYKRPTMTEIDGETFDSPAKTTVEKANVDVMITLSPINEVLAISPVAKPAGARAKRLRLYSGASGRQSAAQFEQFIGEIYRLALFAGTLQSGLDLAPRLPLEPVAVGDTWKRTVGYQPQKLGGKDAKQAVQRLDYTYTYQGRKRSNGREVLRVQAKLNLKTDLGEFVNQSVTGGAETTGLEKLPMTLDATVDFDLDPVTRETLRASATSSGGFQIVHRSEKRVVLEERFKGRTSMERVAPKLAAK